MFPLRWIFFVQKMQNVLIFSLKFFPNNNWFWLWRCTVREYELLIKILTGRIRVFIIYCSDKSSRGGGEYFWILFRLHQLYQSAHNMARLKSAALFWTNFHKKTSMQSSEIDYNIYVFVFVEALPDKSVFTFPFGSRTSITAPCVCQIVVKCVHVLACTFTVIWVDSQENRWRISVNVLKEFQVKPLQLGTMNYTVNS